MEIEFPSYQMCPRKHSFAKVMKYSGIKNYVELKLRKRNLYLQVTIQFSMLEILGILWENVNMVKFTEHYS